MDMYSHSFSPWALESRSAWSSALDRVAIDGLILLYKNTSRERTTPIIIPLSKWGAKTRVLIKEMIAMAPSYHCAFQAWMKPETFISPRTAIMMIAANTDWGRW